MPTLVGRDSRPNCLLKNELRRYEPRSRFPKKPPFRAHFRAFYPHPAHKSALRAEVAAHFLAPGKRGWSPLATVLPSHAPRFRRDLPRANPAAYRPDAQLVHWHLKRAGQVRQPPLVAIELPGPDPPMGQLATRQELPHRRARVALPGSWGVIPFPVELRRDLLDRPALLAQFDDPVDQLIVMAQ